MPLPAEKIVKNFGTRGEAEAFKDGLEYVGHPRISTIWITEKGGSGYRNTFEVTFYEEV